jgi:anti-sigma B factor antagonist
VSEVASFSVEIATSPAGTVLHLRGVIDAHTSPEFETALNGLLKGGQRRAVLDFREVEYVSSAGFGALLSSIHGFRLEGADVKVSGMSESIRRVFDMLGFGRVLDVCPSVETALARFDAPSQAGPRNGGTQA